MTSDFRHSFASEEEWAALEPQGSGGSAPQSKIWKSCRGCFTVPVLATPILVARIGFWPFFFSSQLGLILF